MFKTNLEKAIEQNGGGWFNCGGFALGTFDWYLPHERNSYRDYLRNRGGYDEREVLAETVYQIMIDGGENIRFIDSLDEVKRDEYAIAYRIYEGDFHFRLCYNGQWYEKMGSGYIELVDNDQIFTEEWPGGYNSRIVLFAQKKKIFLREVS